MRKKRTTWEDFCDTTDIARDPRTFQTYQVATLTAGRARAILSAAASAGLVGMSKINLSLTKEKAHEVLGDSLGDKGDADPIHRQIAKNIIREFRRQAKAIAAAAEIPL